jgi:Protein of unknown function (DUF3025)
MSIAAQLALIDWSAPWWQPWRGMGQSVARNVALGATVAQALNAQLTTNQSDQVTRTLQFVPQSALPEGEAYEAFIYRTAQVPTRENLHDFFNGLAWLVFPHTKRRLNALQAGDIKTHGVQTLRGPLRDALTLFDENAALWPAANTSAELLHALRAKDWQRAFIDLRSHWHSASPVLFGHALLEKLVTPYKSITAHVFAVPAAQPGAGLGSLDAAVAQQLGPAALVPKPFIPLPVLGVPQWWPANENSQFYFDTQVFRLPKP